MSKSKKTSEKEDLNEINNEENSNIFDTIYDFKDIYEEYYQIKENKLINLQQPEDLLKEVKFKICIYNSINESYNKFFPLCCPKSNSNEVINNICIINT